MSEKRDYTTIALARSVYSILLKKKHTKEKKEDKSMSFSEVIRQLCMDDGDEE